MILLGDILDNVLYNSHRVFRKKQQLKPLNHIITDHNPPFSPTKQVQAEDRDEGGNGRVTYSIQSPGNSTRRDRTKAFTIDEDKGTIRLVTKMLPGEVTLFVEASDRPSNPSETRTSLAVVTV